MPFSLLGIKVFVKNEKVTVSLLGPLTMANLFGAQILIESSMVHCLSAGQGPQRIEGKECGSSEGITVKHASWGLITRDVFVRHLNA